MYYVYILKHPTKERIYIGFSTDLRSRLKRHPSEHPVWRLAYYEAYASEARHSQRAAAEALWKCAATAEETNHEESQRGLKRRGGCRSPMW